MTREAVELTPRVQERGGEGESCLFAGSGRRARSRLTRRTVAGAPGTGQVKQARPGKSPHDRQQTCSRFRNRVTEGNTRLPRKQVYIRAKNYRTGCPEICARTRDIVGYYFSQTSSLALPRGRCSGFYENTPRIVGRQLAPSILEHLATFLYLSKLVRDWCTLLSSSINWWPKGFSESHLHLFS